MRILLPIFISLLLVGCSTIQRTDLKLYDNYRALNNEVKKGTIVTNRAKYFTPEYLKEFIPEEKETFIGLEISSYIAQEQTHHQIFKNNISCLTIIGIDEQEQPLSLHLEYKKHNHDWLVNSSFLQYLEDVTYEADESICPADLEKIILDEMNNF